MSSVCIPVFLVGVESQEFRFLFLFDVGNPSKIEEKKLLFEKKKQVCPAAAALLFSGQTFF